MIYTVEVRLKDGTIVVFDLLAASYDAAELMVLEWIDSLPE